MQKLSRRFFKFFALSCLTFVFFSQGSFAAAQPSVIETIQNLFPSIVDISAGNTAVGKSGRRLAAASYERKGAGVIITSSGYIITNYHIVARARKIGITLFNRTVLPAKVVSIFRDMDLALLKIEVPGTLTAVELADSDTFSLGDEVFTVGHSEILNQTISQGKIIGLGVVRSPAGAKKGTQLFQVNMNLYKGDSGGPLFDREGRLAGIIVAGEAQVDRSSFVVPSNSIKKLYLEASQKD